MTPFRILLVLFFLCGTAAAATSDSTDIPPQLRGSGLPVPRFVTLKTKETSLRTGPGTMYPIEWVFVRKGMPVEVTAEFDTWRRIRDWEGAEGWVHQSLLSGQRAVVVTGTLRALRREPSPQSRIIAQLEPGVFGALSHCEDRWCRIVVDSYHGWLRREEMWGVYPDEVVK